MTDLEVIPDVDHDGKPDRPKCTRAFVEALIADAGHRDKLAIVGRRGYFHDLGKDRKANDRGLYDDAIFLLSPTEFVAFNANTDPSLGATGEAVLEPGRYLYEPGTHNRTKAISRQYRALIQAQAVSILRVDAAKPEVGWFGINIHRGGHYHTSSAGCQTIWPDQWDEFMAGIDRIMAAAAVKTIPYILTEYRRAA